MAPFRASRATRSGRPGGPVDENVFLDGLPVRQWRLQESTVGAPTNPYGPPGENGASSGDMDIKAWPRLGMPKGSEMYTPWHQQLLRGLRNGSLLRMRWNGGPAAGSLGSIHQSMTDDENDADGDGVPGTHTTEGAAKSGSKSSTAIEQGFLAKRWMQVSRDMEEPEREYLAKRRKGATATFGTGVNGISVPVASAGPMRKTKVRKLDANGNPTVFEVLVPEGQTVEGEITEDVTLENAAAAIVTPAPGTYVEGVGIANQDGIVVANETGVPQVRRKPPPPRRKPKRGPGRGHKKIPLPEGESGAPSTDGNATSEAGDANDIKQDGIGGEGDENKEGEDDDDDDEGDEVEEGEEDDEDDQEMSEATPPFEQKYSETPEPSVLTKELHSEHPLRQVVTIDNDDQSMDIDGFPEPSEEALRPPEEPPRSNSPEHTTTVPERSPSTLAEEPSAQETFSRPTEVSKSETAEPLDDPPEEQQPPEPTVTPPSQQQQPSPIRPELEPFTPPTPPAPPYEPLSQVSTYDEQAGPPAAHTSEILPSQEAFSEPRRPSADNNPALHDTSAAKPAIEPHGTVVDESLVAGSTLPKPEEYDPPLQAQNESAPPEATEPQATRDEDEKPMEVKEPDPEM